jgi:hypothetical protein
VLTILWHLVMIFIFVFFLNQYLWLMVPGLLLSGFGIGYEVAKFILLKLSYPELNKQRQQY